MAFFPHMQRRLRGLVCAVGVGSGFDGTAVVAIGSERGSCQGVPRMVELRVAVAFREWLVTFPGAIPS